MAFTPNTLNQVSSGKNTVAPVQWAYSTDDTAAAVLASGYFNDAQDGFNNTNGRFKVDDVITVVASDSNEIIKITVVTTNVETEAFSLGGGGGVKTIVFADEFTWSGGGVFVSTPVPGVLASDQVVASISSDPTQAAYLSVAVASAGTINVNLSAANTSNDAVISYLVLR